MSYRLAIASRKGIAVDSHFGLANNFLIFQIDDEKTVRYLGNRSTTAACLATCCSKGDEEKAFCTISHELQDVQAIVVSKIGDTAANYLEHRGFTVYESPQAKIEPLVNKIMQDKLYETDRWQ